MRALTLHQPWAQLMVWGLKNIETRSWAAPRNLTGQRMAIHAGKREPKPTEWNIEIQLAVLQRAAGSHSMPMGAVVATTMLIECMQVIGEPDDNGLVSYRGFGELGDEPEYDATITDRPLWRLLGGQVAVGVPGRAACGTDSDKRPAGSVDAAGETVVEELVWGRGRFALELLCQLAEGRT